MFVSCVTFSACCFGVFNVFFVLCICSSIEIFVIFSFKSPHNIYAQLRFVFNSIFRCMYIDSNDKHMGFGFEKFIVYTKQLINEVLIRNYCINESYSYGRVKINLEIRRFSLSIITWTLLILFHSNSSLLTKRSIKNLHLSITKKKVIFEHIVDERIDSTLIKLNRHLNYSLTILNMNSYFIAKSKKEIKKNTIISTNVTETWNEKLNERKKNI